MTEKVKPILIVVLVVLVGCGVPTKSSSNEGTGHSEQRDSDDNGTTNSEEHEQLNTKPKLEGVRWKLVELRGKAIADQPDAKGAFIMFGPGDLKIAKGNLGCNQFSAKYELDYYPSNAVAYDEKGIAKVDIMDALVNSQRKQRDFDPLALLYALHSGRQRSTWRVEAEDSSTYITKWSQRPEFRGAPEKLNKTVAMALKMHSILPRAGLLRRYYGLPTNLAEKEGIWPSATMTRIKSVNNDFDEPSGRILLWTIMGDDQPCPMGVEEDVFYSTLKQVGVYSVDDDNQLTLYKETTAMRLERNLYYPPNMEIKAAFLDALKAGSLQAPKKEAVMRFIKVD